MIGATLGAFGAFVISWKGFNRLRTKLSLSNFRAFENEAGKILERLRVSCNANNVMLCWLHNGGRPMTITSLKKSSVIIESVTNSSYSIKDDWQGMPVFGDDLDILIKVQSGVLKSDVFWRDNIRNGVIKMRMEQADVQGVLIAEAFATDMGYYYAIVEVPNADESLTNGDLYALKIAQAQLRRLCQKVYNQGILE